MGFDGNGLLFLQRTYKQQGAFGSTATIGRQGIHLPGAVLHRFIKSQYEIEQGDFADDLLVRAFGSSEVTSIDNSAYEGASTVLDLNLEMNSELEEKFDTVIDGGSIEHIFDSKTAINNISRLVKPGGQILHMTPSNNWCGHGFYQFSPEFFFAVYSEQRGFSDVEVLLAREGNYKTWYRVEKPRNGQRAEIHTGLPVTCLVRAKKYASNPLSTAVQQSDYITLWHENGPGPSGVVRDNLLPLKRLVKRVPWLAKIATNALFSAQQTSLGQVIHYWFTKGLNRRNKWLTKVSTRV